MNNILLSIEECIEKLNKGEIIIFPTDTLFGMLANAFNEKAVKKIYELKKRDENKPLLIITDDFGKVKDLIEIKNWHYFFIEEWPESLTLVFKVKKELEEKLKYLHRGKNSIAVRIPKDKLLLELLKKVDYPLVAPSANYQNEKPAKNIEEAYKYFKDEVFYFKTDKELEGLPSTIIDLTNFPPKIVREGKYKLNFFYFKFLGHEKIKATHKYTFEITKEDFLTEKGDCIIGIKGFSNKEFQEKTKNWKELEKVRYFIFSKYYFDKGIGYLTKTENPSESSFVVRRSKFKDERTGIIKSNKTALTINRKLIKELKEKKEAFIMFKKVEVENLIIDVRSLFENNWLNFLPRRLKKRIDFKKEKDLFDKDLIAIINKEKIRAMDLIKIEFMKELEKNKEFLLKKIKKIEKVVKEIFDIRNTFILKRSLLFDFDYSFLGKTIEIKDLNNLNFKFAIFSNNSYILKKLKKKGLTTFSEKDKYFVDFVINLE